MAQSSLVRYPVTQYTLIYGLVFTNNAVFLSNGVVFTEYGISNLPELRP